MNTIFLKIAKISCYKGTCTSSSRQIFVKQ